MKNYWIAGALIVAASGAVAAADSARGRQLYETRCTSCHAVSVHGRTPRVADSCAAIRDQVARWNDHLGATWSGDEIDDVTLWLNERYYRFPVQNGRCATPMAAQTRGPHG